MILCELKVLVKTQSQRGTVNAPLHSTSVLSLSLVDICPRSFFAPWLLLSFFLSQLVSQMI